MPEENDNKIKELEEKIVELENNWKRALADYRNYQKRAEEEKLEFVTYANEIIIRKILPVLDNLEMLNKHINDAGLSMIIKNLEQSLGEEGLENINAENEEFDPELMEALELVEGTKNKVIEVVNKGYLLRNKLIRPARVKVGNGDNPVKKEEQ